MSYVIQNFYRINLSYRITPRVKLLAFFKNINIINFFFKYFLLTLNDTYYWNNFFFYFTTTFYFKNFLFFFKRWDYKVMGYYTDSFSRSLLYFNCSYFLKPFESTKTDNLTFSKSNLNFNTYLVNFKTAPIKISKKVFKNFLFFLLYYLNNFWFSYNIFFSFSLNFFFITHYWFIYPFYNGPFFKIYHY